MTKSASPNPVRGGDPLTYVIEVRNLGGQTASPVRLVDTPPTNFVYTDFQTTSGDCAVIGTLVGGELDCDLGALAPGALVTVTIVGFVPQEGTVINTAVVDPFGQVNEFDETNNQAQVSVVISPPPTPTPTPTFTPTPTPIPGDIAVTKTDSVDPVTSGAPLTYTIVLTNIGQATVGGQTDPATGQVIPIPVIDQLPPEFAVSGFTVDAGGTCELATVTDIHCDLGAIAPGDSVTITVTGSITTPIPLPAVENRVLVDLPISDVPELIEVANNIAVETTEVLLPTPTPTFTPTATPTPTFTPTSTPTPTPCGFPGPACTPTPTPTATPTPLPDQDQDGLPDSDELLLGTDPNNPDTDGDGCADGEEVGPDETLGGLRDPLNPWDFYDVAGPGGGPRDLRIDLPNDILGVITRYQLRAGDPTYDPTFDRGPTTGPYPWNMTAPDGTIDLPNDILGVVNQFGHSCAGPP